MQELSGCFSGLGGPEKASLRKESPRRNSARAKGSISFPQHLRTAGFPRLYAARLPDRSGRLRRPIHRPPLQNRTHICRSDNGMSIGCRGIWPAHGNGAGKCGPSMPVLHAISLSFPAPSAFVIRAERRRASDLRPFHYKIPHIPPASRSRVLHIIEKDPAQRLRPDTGHAYGCFTAMPHTSDAAMVVFPLFVRFFDTFFALLSCFFICK